MSFNIIILYCLEPEISHLTAEKKTTDTVRVHNVSTHTCTHVYNVLSKALSTCTTPNSEH